MISAMPGWSAGSSPRSRGTLRITLRDAASDRFIPALAGNTPAWRGSCSSPAVHPRARGEHCRSPASMSAAIGSSPRSRGTPALHRDPAPLARFIPALAGNTAKTALVVGLTAVHPRARGEHWRAARTRRALIGSSPRSRGTLARLPEQIAKGRFIPALAGNTLRDRIRNHRVAVHPRARGEHLCWSMSMAKLPGSSPRSRGTQFLRIQAQLLRRFIPALAGNTFPCTPWVP